MATRLYEMLVMLLKQEGCFEVVGGASGGMEGLKLCPRCPPGGPACIHGTGAARVEWVTFDAEPAARTGVVDAGRRLHRRDRIAGLLRESAGRATGFVRKQDSVSELRDLQAALAGVRHVSRSSERLVRTRGEDIFGILTLQESAVVQMTAEAGTRKSPPLSGLR